jgi:hypothetical protein
MDLTKVSSAIVENFMQGQDFNNLWWFCFKNDMLQKLPSNLFYCSHLQVFDLKICYYLQIYFYSFDHDVNSSLNVDKK